jgi:hypothetical protein
VNGNFSLITTYTAAQKGTDARCVLSPSSEMTNSTDCKLLDGLSNTNAPAVIRSIVTFKVPEFMNGTGRSWTFKKELSKPRP